MGSDTDSPRDITLAVNDALVAHRFQRLLPLRAAEDYRLDVSRDVASDALGTLLTLHVPGLENTEIVVRARLRLFEDGPVYRSFTPDAVLESEEGIHFFLSPIEAHPWESQLLASDAETALADLRVMMAGIAGHLKRGCPAGGLSLATIYRDEKGPFFLPDAYVFAPAGATSTELHHDPVACAHELRVLRDDLSTLCRRYLKMAGRRLDDTSRDQLESIAAALLEELPEARPSTTNEPLISMLEALREEGGCVVVKGEPASRQEALERIRRWSHMSERRCVTLRPHASPASRFLQARGEDGEGPVVLLDGFGGYSSFAEGLLRLRNRGWLDGREILVVAPSEQPMDGACELFLEGVKRRGEERYLEMTLEPVELPKSITAAEGLGLRILETLAVAARPLSAVFLGRAFSVSAERMSTELCELWSAGWAQLLYARPDEIPEELQLLVTLPAGRTPEVALDRSAEINALLATALEELSGKGGLGRGWLRLVSSLEVEPTRAPAQVRQLVSLAQRDGEPLLEYAAYDALLSVADRARPRLEDRAQAALSMGEQHRLNGDLDRAGQMFQDGLDALQSGSGPPSKRLVPLAAELILKMALLARDRNRHLETHRLITEALERYEDELPANNRGRLYLDLAWALLKLGRTREASNYCELVLKILDAERYPHEVARAYNQLGVVQYEESNYSQSLINLQRALVLREQTDDTIGVARSYNNLSLTYRSLGRLVEAQRCLERSLELKIKAGDTRAVAITQLNLGLLAIDQGDYAQARRSAAECLHVARRHRHRQMEAEAHGLLGEAAMGEGKLEEAQDLLLRDLEICVASNHETERLATLRRYVGLLIQLGKLDEARQRLGEAKELLDVVPSRFEAAMLGTFEAELASREGNFEPAVRVLSESARSFGSMRRFDLQLDSLVRRSWLQLELGRGSDARRSYLEARDLAARHEIHRVPELMRELSTRMDDLAPAAGGSPSSEVDYRLEALADLVGPGGDVEAGRPEGALRAVAAVLSTDEVYWARAPRSRTLGIVRGEVVTGPPPDDVSSLVSKAESDRVPGSFREDSWVGVRVRGADVGWLAVSRSRPLEEGEFTFLQSVAGILSLSTGSASLPVERESLAQDDYQPGADYGIIGNSPEMQAVLRMIDLVKENDVTILLLGENGTGKDLVARAIHQAGPRSDNEMVAVNCASIPTTLLESELFGHEKGAFTSAVDRRIGIFERADGGTVFLDEIAEMPLPMQAKLLRVLQDKSFSRVGGSKTIQTNVRVIAATNRDLSEEVEQSRFRMDLFYRLNVISIHLPPLRERREDLKALVHHFLRQFSDEFRRPVRGITDEAIDRLKEYEWPGNIRELENAIKKAIVFAGREILRVEDMPEAGRVGSARGRKRMDDAVRAIVEGQDYSEDRPLMPRLELLLAYEVVRAIGNKTKAAQLLGITKPTLYNRLRRYIALYGGEEGPGDTALFKRARG